MLDDCSSSLAVCHTLETFRMSYQFVTDCDGLSSLNSSVAVHPCTVEGAASAEKAKKVWKQLGWRF